MLYASRMRHGRSKTTLTPERGWAGCSGEERRKAPAPTTGVGSWPGDVPSLRTSARCSHTGYLGPPACVFFLAPELGGESLGP